MIFQIILIMLELLPLLSFVDIHRLLSFYRTSSYSMISSFDTTIHISFKISQN